MFSIPINQKLSEPQFFEFFNFCAGHKDYIYDLYFTCRMPPFTQDAMGDIIATDEESYAPIETALYIQNTLGIRVSATFNNIQVPPTQSNLDLFIQNFKQLYDAGIRSATIPHSHWTASGQIQKEFPDLQIKNTILRNVNRATEVAKAAEAGFHYVNLDRDLMRDRDELIKCRKAANKYGIKLSLLANEGCLGACGMMDEHFQFNNGRLDGPQYFKDPISRVSCPKWDVTDPSTPLKTANIPPWREEWEELLEYVDVFKMHGRESIAQIYDTMNIVTRYALNEEILFSGFEEYIDEHNLEERPIDAWRKFIKNCKFDCWDCNKCDKLYEAKSNVKPHPLIVAVAEEIVDSVNYNNTLNIPGLTSPRVQNLLYGLGSNSTAYLEIGSALGSTAVAVGMNEHLEMHCVDNWQEDIQPLTSAPFLPKNTKEQFIENTKNISNLYIHDGDYLSIDKSEIEDIDLMFYDGPKEEQNIINAVKYYADSLSETAIIVFDDANWDGVVTGANKGLEDANLKIIYNRVIVNAVEDVNMWWNGLYIVVVQK